MSTTTSQSTWNQKIQDFLLHAGLHDKRSQNQAAMRALWAENTQIIPRQTTSAYVSSLYDYLRNVQVVGAEQDNSGVEASDRFKREFDVSPLQSIISIRGFPDHGIIRFLGRQLQIDPDVLLSHLPYPPTFEIRPLSSFPSPTLHILMISLGFYPPGDSNSGDIKRQVAIDHKTEQYNRDLFENNTWGPEQCHKVNLHGQQFFSVEQRATFVVYEKGARSWSGIVLNNSGTEHSESPWCHDRRFPARFLPLKRYGNLPLTPGILQHEQNTWQTSSQRRPDPCLSRVHQGTTMSEIERNLCLQDPILFVADILKTSALSWRLFFSFLHNQHQSLEGDPAEKADRLHHDKEVVDRARRYFGDVIGFIDHRKQLDWPTCSSAENRITVDATINTLWEDFKTLQSEAAGLGAECNDSIALEMNKINIIDSKKSIEQAEKVQMLTFLAYLFIPLTFVAGVFGMNVTAFTSPNPPIWKFFAVAGPITIVCALIPTWRDVVQLIRTIREALHRNLRQCS